MKRINGLGVVLINEERERQIDVEGWTHDHDSKYKRGELAAAGRCYALMAELQVQHGVDRMPACFIPREWPWERRWWKPSKDPKRNLAKAGALIAAEIDRQIREGNGSE